MKFVSSAILALLLAVAAFGLYSYFKPSYHPALIAAPMQGSAPLQVQFTIDPPCTIDGNGGGYRLEFGDGDSQSPINLSGGDCTSDKVMHTYTKAGTYTAPLYLLSFSGNIFMGSTTVTVQ